MNNKKIPHHYLMSRNVGFCYLCIVFCKTTNIVYFYQQREYTEKNVRYKQIKKELYLSIQLFVKVLCISNHKTCSNVVALKGIEPLISP